MSIGEWHCWPKDVARGKLESQITSSKDSFVGMHSSKLTSFREPSRGVTDIMLKLKLRKSKRDYKY